MNGKRVVITGASGGIGAAGARHFAALGAHVVGTDVVDGPGEALFADLGPPHAYRHVDLTDPDAVAATLDEAVSHLGGLDVLWLNAGVMTRARNEDPIGDPLATLTAEGYRRVFDVNVGANIAAVRVALPLLEGDGDIVITASGAGLTPFSPDPIYSASKHAVIGLVRSLGPVLDGSGVRIHAVCPGGTDTPMAGTVLERSQLQSPTAVAECVIALLEAGGTGDAWTALPNRPPVRIRFPELRGRGFTLDPEPGR
jgi:NAD(P)-dependent dehydrogenase (short-subunit alcohol dehydrogenase family)